MDTRPSSEFDFECLRNRLASVPDVVRLGNLVTCPCCLNVALPPIYSCCVGHNVCSSCHRGKGHLICRQCHKGHQPTYPKPCTVCNSKIFRNIVMEQVLDKCQFPCVHSAEGCPFIGNGYEMAAHSIKCDLRLINCPTCKRDFRSEPFLKHITETYKGPEVLSSSGTFHANFRINSSTGYIEDASCAWVKYANRDFFLRVEEGGGLNCIWMFMSLLGGDSEVKEWQTRMTLENKEKGLELTYECPMTSIRSSAIFVRKQGHCVTVVPLVIKPFVRNNFITVKVQIMSTVTKNGQEEVNLECLQEAATVEPPPKQGVVPEEPDESPSDTDESNLSDDGNATVVNVDVSGRELPDVQIPPVPDGFLSKISRALSWVTKWRNGEPAVDDAQKD